MDLILKNLKKGEFFGCVVDKNHRFLLKDYTISHNSDPVTSATLSIVQVFLGIR